MKYEAEQAEREGDFGRVAEMRYGKIKEPEDSESQFRKQVP